MTEIIYDIYIFLDTNIFLHFTHFELINWSKILNSIQRVTIVVASTVMEELDNHKYNQNKKVAKRAKKLLPQIEDIIEGLKECKYPLIYIVRKPSDETLIRFNLTKGEQDDMISGAIIEFTTLHNSEEIVFVTHDVGRISVSPIHQRFIKFRLRLQIKPRKIPLRSRKIYMPQALTG